ncbi:MAG: hypothetical protein U1F26_08855 [Lysobacterales bacterium]
MEPALQLFLVAVEVDADGHCPPYYRQITVSCALWASGATQAIEWATTDLQRSGYRPLPGQARAQTCAPAQWEHTLRLHWPARCGLALPPIPQLGAALPAPVQLGLYPHD